MSDAPLISIITPTYNRERFILEAVNSVLAQTYENWELIIVDDGSVDNTRQVLEPFLQDSRIRYIYQENQGQSKARNEGIRQAKGQYISFLDSDNRWFKDKLLLSYQAISKEDDVDILYANGVTIDEQGQEISRSVMPKYSGLVTSELIKDNFISMNTTLVRTECFSKYGLFDEEDRLAEDYELWLRFSVHCKFLYIPDFIAEYRVMEDQLSSDKPARFSANEKILQKFVKAYAKDLQKREVNRSLSSFYVRKGRYFTSERQFGQAIKDICNAIRLAPYWSGTYRALLKVFITMFSKK